MPNRVGRQQRPRPKPEFADPLAELAFEGTIDGHASTFLARDLLGDAFLALR